VENDKEKHPQEKGRVAFRNWLFFGGKASAKRRFFPRLAEGNF